MADQVYNESMCEEVRRLMAAGKSIARVATNLGVHRRTVYAWCEKHPEFADCFERGKDAAQAHWEDVGSEGIEGEIKNFSATAWMFTMKNRFREDYTEDKESKNVSEDLVSKILDKLIE